MGNDDEVAGRREWQRRSAPGSGCSWASAAVRWRLRSARLLVVLTTAAAQAQPVHGAVSLRLAGGIDRERRCRRRAGGAPSPAGTPGKRHAPDGQHGPMVAPLQSTEARLRVTGNTVRGTVTQRFRNPGAEWLEGSYLFPLPDDAAVDHLRMKVGDRVVEGRDAREGGGAARVCTSPQQGQRASLVEQKRPNAFTAQVTNIAPGAIIEIELQYQQTLALRDGAWRLRFPGVVAPRYSSPPDADRRGTRDRRRSDVRPSDRPLSSPRSFVATAGSCVRASCWPVPAVRPGQTTQPATCTSRCCRPTTPRLTRSASPSSSTRACPSCSPRRRRIAWKCPAGLRTLAKPVAPVEWVSGRHPLSPADPRQRRGAGSCRPGFRARMVTGGGVLPLATLRHERHGDSYYGMHRDQSAEPGHRARRRACRAR